MSKVETLHAPHGTEVYACPKCRSQFATLFQFNRHAREQHGDKAVKNG